MSDETPKDSESHIAGGTGTIVGGAIVAGGGSSIAAGTGTASGSSSMWGKGEGWTTPPPDHPIYALIGTVAARWSFVEQMLDAIIWDLVGTNQKFAACLTGQFNGTFPRHNAIIALLEAHGRLTPELKKRIETERGACNNTSAKRNRIVHDPWYVETRGAVGAYRSWPKEDLRFGIRTIPQDVIDDALASINKRLTEAIRLHMDLTP